MEYQVNFFWRSVFPVLFAISVGLLILYYGIKKKKKFDEKGQRYVIKGQIIPTHEDEFIESNKQYWPWFVFLFISYLVAIWIILIFAKDPSYWLDNPREVIKRVVLFPLLGLSAWYWGWVITDAKKRNMDIKSYGYPLTVIRHIFVRDNYPIINEIAEQKSFQPRFLVGLAIWLILAIAVLLTVIWNLEKLLNV